MFLNCQKGGQNFAFPDVCKTPVGPSEVPIPYPNTALGATANPGTAVLKVLISGTPAHKLGTIIPLSNGDNAGVLGGVVSNMMMGPRRNIKGDFAVLIGGKPATRMGDPTAQNGSSPNAMGMSLYRR